MDGHAAGVDGCHSGRSEHHHTLTRLILQTMQECGLPGAGLAREEKVCAGLLHNASGERQFLVDLKYGLGFAGIFKSIFVFFRANQVLLENLII